jgi:hypothetical protein
MFGIGIDCGADSGNLMLKRIENGLTLNVIENDRVSAPSDCWVSRTTSRYDATFLSINTEPPSRTILILKARQYNSQWRSV